MLNRFRNFFQGSGQIFLTGTYSNDGCIFGVREYAYHSCEDVDVFSGIDRAGPTGINLRFESERCVTNHKV